MFIYFVCGFLVFSSLYFFLQALPKRRTRWNKYRMVHYVRSERFVAFSLKFLWLSRTQHRLDNYEQLLVGCGFKFLAIQYLIVKRCMMIVSFAIGATVYVLGILALPFSRPILLSVVGIAMLLWLVGMLDKHILSFIKKKRSERIVQEVYVLSKQLLYYGGSKMNLHGKLKRCIPFTTALRNDMELLTREWYEGAESAINKFKHRLGTDEGFSFAETLNSLRLHENERYYDLLRQRIHDYKEKIELDKESKKEANSYLLFILAGLPIMNTFRVFIYPWVQEGQKLFESLN